MAGRRQGSYWDNWEAKRKREIAEFISGWSWERVVDVWKSRLNELNARIQPLFESVHVHDPANPHGRESVLSWWPSASIRTLQKGAQRHFDHHPGTRGPIHPNEMFTRKGEIETVHYLWGQRDDLQGIAAVLIAASIFSRVGSSRQHYPRENWPPIYCVKEVEKWTYDVWQAKTSSTGWHYACTGVIPSESDDYEYKIETLGALVRYLAEEHAALLHKYRPVVIKYKPERDPFLAKTLAEEYEREAEHQKQWKKQYEEQRRMQAEEQVRLTQNHPRWAEWTTVGKDELERLVWTKPTRKLAEEFGISDVAINKQCKKLGIRKPPVGFWNKVKAGKIPHPNGRPFHGNDK